MVLEIRNSYSNLTNAPKEVENLVKRVLTYQNDIQAELRNLFFQLKRFKGKNSKKYYATLSRINFLKETEWVCWYQDGRFPTGLINIVKEAISTLNVPYKVVDHRKKPVNDQIMKWRNEPFPPRYYQKDMIDLGLSEGRGVFVAAVGTGKSLVLARILKELSITSLVIVPSVALGVQLESDFKKWFGDHMVETVNTAKVRSGKSLRPIRISTIQSLASLQKSGELQNLVHDVGALFVDEIHHAGSASYTNLLKEIDHVYYRFGFTGTFLRNDSKSLDMWGFLSNVLYRYPAHKAIGEGYLTPIKASIYELHAKPSRSYPKEYDNAYCGNPELLNKVKEICLAAKADEQVLILVKNKDKAGVILNEFLELNGIENSYISGDDKKEVINSTIQAFNEKKIRRLIGSSVIGEGIDIRSTDHLIMCQGGKSEIVIVQGVGRAVRLFEGKSIANVHDFDFPGTKYMRKHTSQRIDIYSRNFECEINRFSS